MIGVAAACGKGDDAVFAGDAGGDAARADASAVDAADAAAPELKPPDCSGRTAPASCALPTDLPDGAPTDASYIPLPDGGTSPPVGPRESCHAGRTAFECIASNTAQAGVTDGAVPNDCVDLCCPDEYGISCFGSGFASPPPGCHEVGLAPAALLCCPCS